MATKTGNSYTTGTMTDRMTIPTANLGVSTTLSARKQTPGDCDKDRQPEMAIYTFWVPILQLLVVDRCRNHLANLLSSSFDAICQRCNYFRFEGGHTRIDIDRSCTHLPTLFSTHIYMVFKKTRFGAGILSVPHTVSGFGRHFRLLVIIGIA